MIRNLRNFHYSSNMKVGVTGGAGFVGTNLVRALLGVGHEVVVIDDFSTGLPQNLVGLDVRLVSGSFTETHLVKEFGNELEFIFHLGARGSVPRSLVDPQGTFASNIVGTQNILELARERKIPIVFSSSSSVYGDNSTLPKTESLNLKPISPYAASKAAGEHLVLSYARSFGLEARVFRFFNIYGPYQRPDHAYAAVIPKWISLAERDETIEIFGDGNQIRDFTFVGDVVEVLIQSMNLRQSQDSELINLAFGKPHTLNELVVLMKDAYANLKVNYVQKRHGDVYLSANDPKLLISHYPQIQPTSLTAGLQLTIDWLRRSTLLHRDNA
jgi:UDP-glucose 4-epimerase